jgi:hypothetical protein
LVDFMCREPLLPTIWLRQAGPMMFGCQQSGDPGLACSQLC